MILNFRKIIKTLTSKKKVIIDKDKLLTLVIIIAVTGIVSLFVLSKVIEIKPTPIGNIDESFLGKTVKIEGQVSKVDNIANITFIYVDNSKTPLVIYSKLDIDKNKNISALGKVEEYKDTLQINVDKLEYR